MTTGRRLLAMTAFGLALLFAVVVVVFGFPSLSDDGSSESAQLPCPRDARNVVLPFGIESAKGRWDHARPFPIAQDELRAEAIGDVVYVGGGLTHVGPDLVSTDVLFAFDPKLGTYRRLAPLPRRIDHPGFVGAGGDLYLIGGFRDWLPTNEVFRFSPEEGEWKQLASMEVPRGSPAAEVIGGRIVVAGGGVGDEGRIPVGTVEIFDIATGRWSPGPDLPTARHHAGAEVLGDTMYVVGGRDARDYSLDVVERYDARTNAWRPAPALPLGVGGLAVVRARDRLVAIGGGDDIEDWVTPATWAFDPATDRWQRLADLRAPRHGHAAAALGADVYVFGGAPCPGYGLTDSVEKLEVAG